MAKAARNDANPLRDIERQMKLEQATQAAINKRRHGRLRPGMMWCNLGKVLDFSASGLRLATKHNLEGEQVVVIKANEQSMLLHGTIVWARKLGFRRYQVGIEFADVSPQDLAKLRNMGKAI